MNKLIPKTRTLTVTMNRKPTVQRKRVNPIHTKQKQKRVRIVLRVRRQLTHRAMMENLEGELHKNLFFFEFNYNGHTVSAPNDLHSGFTDHKNVAKDPSLTLRL